MSANTAVVDKGCPSRYQLGRFEAEGATGALAPHVRGCARCGAVLRELGEARVDLLGPDPAQASALAARRILAAADERRAARRWWQRPWLPIGLVPAAAAAAVLVFALGRAPGPHQADGAGDRAKGSIAVEVYGKRGEQVFPVSDGADLLAGDRLRFAYTKPQAGYLMVFGVDDTGRVFPYYQDGILSGIKVEAGSRAMLPGSVELDDHRGFERIFVLWSPRPIEEEAVRAAVGKALAAAGGDLRRAGRLALDAEQVSYLLRRP